MSVDLAGKIAILSDIHGNFFALEAVLRDLEKNKPRTIFFLGDAVGYFPDGEQVLKTLHGLGCISVMGNHEKMLLGSYEGDDSVYRLKFQRDRLSALHLSMIENWPEKMEIAVSANKKLLLVHGSPVDPLHGYIYPDTKFFDHFSTENSFVFMGHTHWPHIFPTKKFVAVNVGSVGLPRDGTNFASYCTLDLETGKCVLHRVPLDVPVIFKKYSNHVHSSVLEKFRR